MPITDTEWNLILKYETVVSLKDIKYLENNELNRPLFLKMGFKEEDLNVYNSLIYYIPVIDIADIVYNEKHHPTRCMKITHVYFSIGTETGVPYGLVNNLKHTVFQDFEYPFRTYRCTKMATVKCSCNPGWCRCND